VGPRVGLEPPIIQPVAQHHKRPLITNFVEIRSLVSEIEHAHRQE